MDLNVVTLVGRLAQDAEMRQAGETVVSSFSIAVSDGFGEKAKTSFFNVNVWGKQADALTKYLVKGTQVGVTGKLAQESWKTKDGETRYNVKVVATNIQLLGSKKSEGTSSSQQSQKQVDLGDIASDDLPF